MLFGIVIKTKPNVIIADSVSPINGFSGLICAKYLGAKFIYQIRDLWPYSLVTDRLLNKKNPLFFIFRILEKILYKYCDWVCTTLPYVKNHISSSWGDPSKITYIPNGVNLEPFLKII